MLTTIALVCGVFLLVYVYPKAKILLASLKKVAQMTDEPDVFFHENRKQPYLDVPWPTIAKMPLVLPPQTYLFNYELYSLGKPDDMIKRRMDHHVFDMPQNVMTDKSVKRELVAVEHMFHREMSSVNTDEIMLSFNSYALQEIREMLIKLTPTGSRISMHSEIYALMVRIAPKALFGPLFNVEGLVAPLKEFDSCFQGLALAGQMNPLLGRLLRYFVLGRGKAGYAKLLRNSQDYAAKGGFEEAGPMIKKMVDGLKALGWDEKALATATATLIFALTTNASDAASWVLLHILQSPRLLSQIRAEIASLPPSSENSSVPDLRGSATHQHLPTLVSAIHETMRLHTNVMSARIAKEDVVFTTDQHSVLVKKGRLVVAPIRALHTDPLVWKDPFAFDGTRFLGEAGQARVKDLYYFGSGISRCAGRNFAVAELLSIVTLCLLNFDFDMSSLQIQRNGQIIDGERIKIIDMGVEIQGVWPGREKNPLGNSAGVVRPDGKYFLYIKPRLGSLVSTSA